MTQTRERATPSSATVLEARDLEAGYGDLKAIRGVSLKASEGRITAVLGRNGAGKTTTLRAISGLTATTAGTVTIDGREVTRSAAHARVGMGLAFVQEGKRIFVDRSVEENLLLGTYSRRLSRAQRREECQRAYERFPILHDRRNLRAGALSGGQQQMLAICGALASNPRVLLLDEPSAGLAPAIVTEVLESVRSLCTEGLAVVLVEQNAERALTVADHVIVLELGCVVVDQPASSPDISSLVQSAYFSGEVRSEV